MVAHFVDDPSTRDVLLTFTMEIRGEPCVVRWDPESGFHGRDDLLNRLGRATTPAQAVRAVRRGLGEPFTTDVDAVDVPVVRLPRPFVA